MTHKYKILIVDDDPDVLFATKMIIKSVGFDTFEASDGETCLQASQEYAPDLILLDVSLPDADGRDLARQIKASLSENRPYIILLSGQKISSDDQVEGLDAGADGYITRPVPKKELIARVNAFIRLKEEENKKEATLDALHSLALYDGLTNLHNRRGFFSTAKHQFKVAQRKGQRIALIFADLDGLKQINDTWGHQKGDQALIETAEIIRDTFRDSDIIARLGGDEFVILITEDEKRMNAALIKKLILRLEEKLALRNSSSTESFKLSISTGFAQCDSKNSCSIEDLLAKADEAMYAQKVKKTSDTN